MHGQKQLRYIICIFMSSYFLLLLLTSLSLALLLKCIARGGEKECKTKRLGNLLWLLFFFGFVSSLLTIFALSNPSLQQAGCCPAADLVNYNFMPIFMSVICFICNNNNPFQQQSKATHLLHTQNKRYRREREVFYCTYLLLFCNLESSRIIFYIHRISLE